MKNFILLVLATICMHTSNYYLMAILFFVISYHWSKMIQKDLKDYNENNNNENENSL